MKTLEVCKEIMRYCAKQGYTNQIHKRELEKAIMLIRGADHRTVQKWLNVLLTFGFIEYIAPQIIKLDFTKMPVPA